MKQRAWAIWIGFIVAIVAPMTPIAWSQPARDTRRDQQTAATARAVDRLRQQIAGEPISRNMTVGNVLDATGGTDTFTKTLQRAQMIGGPRWLDDQTCQVRLEISGPRAAAALVQIVATNPKKSPIDPATLQARLKSWDTRTFSATSTSTGATIEHLRPVDEGAAWDHVSDAARQQALAAAKKNAIGTVVLAMGPIPLANGKVVSDAMTDARVRTPVDQWLASRPGTQVQFHDNLQLEVTLATPPGELADVFFTGLDATKPPIVTLDQPARSRVRQTFETRVPAAPHGVASIGQPNTTGPAVKIPTEPPPWANDQLDADGTGKSKTSQLKAARAAEVDAQAKLRTKVEALELSKGVLLGDAARQDPRVSAVITRTLSRVRAGKVSYQPDGSAIVHLSLDLHDLWEGISTD